jgi:integrase
MSTKISDSSQSSMEHLLSAKLWTVPATRMKSGHEHRVPLSADALAVLDKLDKGGPDDFVFTGRTKGPLSNMALLMLLRRMGDGKLTVHGFRSTFRDWAAECTNFPSEVAEMALAHAVENKVEAAYRRGDLIEKRRSLMDTWAKFCTKAPTLAAAVPLRGKKIES